MRGRKYKGIVIPRYLLFFSYLFMQLLFISKSIASEINGKELNGNIESIIKNGIAKVTVDSTGSEYYDSLLREYAAHITSIKPFNYKKIKNYLGFINRNMSPYQLELNFICNNKHKYSNGDSACIGVLSLNKKKIAGKLRLQTDWKKKDKKEKDKNTVKKTHLLGNYISLKYKDLGVENSSALFKVSDSTTNSTNYKYTVKYTKSFQLKPTAILNASIEHNNVDYLAEVHELDMINRLNDVEYDVYCTQYNYKPSSLVLSLRYKLLYDNSIEYSLGYANRHTKYSHINNKEGFFTHHKIGKSQNYNVNHLYFITKILNLGLIFYGGYEYDFRNNNKHLTGAIFYKKNFGDYSLDISLMHSNRKWKNKEGNSMIDHYKVGDSYLGTRIGKKIQISNEVIKNIEPYVIFLYDHKGRKTINVNKNDNKKEKSLQKGIGIAISPAQEQLKDLETDLFYLQDKQYKSVFLSLKLKF